MRNHFTLIFCCQRNIIPTPITVGNTNMRICANMSVLQSLVILVQERLSIEKFLVQERLPLNNNFEFRLLWRRFNCMKGMAPTYIDQWYRPCHTIANETNVWVAYKPYTSPTLHTHKMFNMHLWSIRILQPTVCFRSWSAYNLICLTYPYHMPGYPSVWLIFSIRWIR
jgi:hypothetical protein